MWPKGRVCKGIQRWTLAQQKCPTPGTPLRGLWKSSHSQWSGIKHGSQCKPFWLCWVLEAPHQTKQRSAEVLKAGQGVHMDKELSVDPLSRTRLATSSPRRTVIVPMCNEDRQLPFWTSLAEDSFFYPLSPFFSMTQAPEDFPKLGSKSGGRTLPL